MEPDQGRDVLHDGRGEAQLTEPCPGHSGTRHLVMMESHPAIRQQPPGPGLADVMQQCGQPHHQVPGQPVLGLQGDGLRKHGQRMLVDVLVPEVLIDLQP